MFLVSQATTCVCLFALSTQQFDIAIDLSRLVLREQSAQSQQSVGNACLWLIRGLAFAAIGTTLSSLKYLLEGQVVVRSSLPGEDAYSSGAKFESPLPRDGRRGGGVTGDRGGATRADNTGTL